MHPFHDYLCGQLDDILKRRGIVVFYDPRREFEPFFDRELNETGNGYDGLPRVFVKERLTFLVRHEGSFFALRSAVEPIADRDKPDPLIVYLPGVERDRKASVLMELEKSGTSYEPQLKRLALNVLRKRFTDGQIDEILRPASVGYDDIVSFLHQGEEGTSPSVLRTIFDSAQSEALITRWLADDEKDKTIVDKDAAVELFKLIDSRLGLPIPENTTVTEAREKLLRYVLVGEFRSDLNATRPSRWRWCLSLRLKNTSSDSGMWLKACAADTRTVTWILATRSKQTSALAGQRSMPAVLATSTRSVSRSARCWRMPASSSVRASTRRRSASSSVAAEVSGSILMLAVRRNGKHAA